MIQPGELSENERKRLCAELAQVEEQQAEALQEGFSLGGGLGHHEQRAKLEDRADRLRQASAEPSKRSSGRGWIGWAILGLVCVGVVVALWIVGGDRLA